MTKLDDYLKRKSISSNQRKTDSEKEAQQRIAELEEQNAMLTECLLEISEIIYS